MKVNESLTTALMAVAALWFIFFACYFAPVDLRLYGIRPRQTNGLIGVLLWPFLHVNLQHLMANSFAFFCLLFLSLSFSKLLTIKALVIITLLGGAAVWTFGSAHTIHIGASGIIFGLLGFLIFLGIFRREWKALIISLLVFLLYGGLLVTLLIRIPGVSWSGHFFGFAAGVIAAWVTRPGRRA